MPKLAVVFAALLTFVSGGSAVSVPTDFPDFTQPVAFHEQVSADLLAGAGLTPNGAPVLVDVSGYQSIGIDQGTGTAAPGARYGLIAQWLSGGANEFDQQVLTFNSPDAAANYPDDIYWQLPVRSPQLQVRIYGTNISHLPVAIFGSTRPVTEHVASTGAYDGALILDTQAVNVAAGGTSAVFYIPPVARAVSIKMNGVGTEAMHFNLDAVTMFNAVAQASNFARYDGTSPNLTVNDIAIPRTGLQVTMSNDGAAAHNLRILVYDAS